MLFDILRYTIIINTTLLIHKYVIIILITYVHSININNDYGYYISHFNELLVLVILLAS